MTKTNKWFTFLAIILAFVVVASCGSSDDDTAIDGDQSTDGDSDATDGDVEDGDVEDGDVADGDVTDGDTTDGDTTDGDVEDGDVTDGDTAVGSISGKIVVSDELAVANRSLKIFRRNPFENDNAQPMETVEVTGEAGVTETTYEFTDIPSATYYMMLFVDVEGTPDDTEDDFKAFYPDRLIVVVDDEEQRDLSNIDMYAGAQNPNWGSVEGTLFIHEQFEGQAITVVAAQQKPGGDVEIWPSSFDFQKAPSVKADEQTRPFSLKNLPNGDYFVVAFVEMETGISPPLFVSPYSPYEIDVADAGKKNYADQMFYVGLADPNLGSVSGTLTLAGPVGDGTLGVYLYALEDMIEPVSWTFVEKNDTDTTYSYVVGNLKENEEFWVAGFFQPSQGKLSLDFWADPLSIGFGDQQTKDWTDINFDIAITTLEGNVAVQNAPGPITNARVLLVKPEGEELGGGVDVQLTEEGGLLTSDYTLYPASGGSWIPFIVLDEDNNGISEGDKWCPAAGGEFEIDGTQLYAAKNITVFYSECAVAK